MKIISIITTFILLLAPKYYSFASTEDTMLFNFENGTQGWWKFSSSDSAVTLSQDTATGSGGSKSSLKAAYRYGKAGAYVGLGIQPGWTMAAEKWRAYANGYIRIGMKSDCGCSARIEIRTEARKSYNFTVKNIGQEWGVYSIPFSEFRLKDGIALDLCRDEISQLVIIPSKSGSQERNFWIDDIALNKSKLPLNDPDSSFNIEGMVSTTDGSPIDGAVVAIAKPDGISILAETQSGKDGRYLVAVPNPARKFKVEPASACPENRSLKAAVNVKAPGMAQDYRWLELADGKTSLDFKLTAVQTPLPLKVVGNRLRDSSGKEVWLQGLCIDSLEWSGSGDNMMKSTVAAVEQWKANCIRIPVKEDFWAGKGPYQNDGGKFYRSLVDAIVAYVSSHGGYTVIDLHRFGAPMPEHLAFWKDAAEHYKKDPSVLLELFNEPHGISWDIWKNGGNLKNVKHKDANVAENDQKNSGDHTTGMQAIVDAVRATGANNVIIAGGLDWSYTLSGILKGYALKDKAGAGGIMYSSHIYPWKSNWKENFLAAAEKYPLFIGEVGDIRSWDDFKFISKDQRREQVGKGEWGQDIIGVIQKYRLNWTAFSFHPRCGPMVISDWDYTPTPYWGIFVKQALVDGRKFPIKKMR